MFKYLHFHQTLKNLLPGLSRLSRDDLPSLCERERSPLLRFLRFMTCLCTRLPASTNIPSLCSHGNHLIYSHSTCLLSRRHMETWHWQMRWKRERERHTIVDDNLHFENLQERRVKTQKNTWTFHIAMCCFLHQELCVSFTVVIQSNRKQVVLTFLIVTKCKQPKF